MWIPSVSSSHHARVPQMQSRDFQGSSWTFSDIRLLSLDPRGKPFDSSVDSPGRRPDLDRQLAEPCREGSYPVIRNTKRKSCANMFRTADDF